MKISYCIATYRRPDKLHNTIRSILSQGDAELDVIVNDNDPEGSASKVVEEFNSNQISYYKNDRNVGMVGNFNAALSHAQGDYVVMITDDDPVEPDHSLTLRELASEYSGKGAYFCFGRSYTDRPELAQHYRIPVGKNREGTNLLVQQYTGRDFALELLSGRIPGYMLWSCGMVRREIAQRIKMPDYGTPYLTDFAYIALACGAEGVVIKNKIIGWQEIHADNFGRKEFADIGKAIDGFRDLVAAKWPGDREIKGALDVFLARWVGGHFGFLCGYVAHLKGKMQILTQYMKFIVAYRLYSGFWVFLLSLLPLHIYQFLRSIKKQVRG